MAESEGGKIVKKLRSKEFRDVAKAVASGTLEGKVLETVEKVTKNWQADLQAYTIGLARMKAVSVTKFLETILKAQDELARRIDLKQMTTGELIASIRILRDINKEDIDFIHDLAFGSGEKLRLLVQDNRIAIGGNVLAPREVKILGGEVTPEGRERLRRLVDGIMQRLNQERALGPGDGPNTTN